METGSKPQTSPGIGDTLAQDHRRCDELFASAEKHASNGEWPQAQQEVSAFTEAMTRHIGFEEQTLFPALEQIIGAGGPTQVMRMEHEQMRTLFRDMQQAAQAQDAPRLLGATETLLILMQQHNMKEENILYRMADQMLGAQGPALAGQFAQS